MESWHQLYKQIEKTPDDFALWENLVEIIEKGDEPDANDDTRSEAASGTGLCKASSPYALQLFRFTFDGFLSQFPLAEFYWVRYAELEFALGHTDNAESVYARAVAAAPYSVVVWSRYAQFTVLTRVADPDVGRSVLERGASCIGSHFLAHTFWDNYLEFEKMHGDNDSVAQLLLRIMAIPLHQYAKYFDMFRKLVASDSVALESRAPPLVIQQFRAEYEVEVQESNDIADETDQQQQQQHTKASSAGVTPNDDDLRERLQTYFYMLYAETEAQVARIFPFERAIKKHYFDVVFVSQSEMAAWNRYLEFEELECSSPSSLSHHGTGYGWGASMSSRSRSQSRVHLLYQRALLATAYNEELWLRYVRWLVGTDQRIEAKNVLRRACTIVPVGRPAVRVYFARLLASEGELETAELLCRDVLTELPNCLEVCICLARILYATSKESSIAFLHEYLGPSSTLNPDEKVEILCQLAAFTAGSGSADGDVAVAELDSLFKQYVSDLGQCERFWRYYLTLMVDNHAPRQVLDSLIESMNSHLTDIPSKKAISHIYLVSILESHSKDASSLYMEADRQVHV